MTREHDKSIEKAMDEKGLTAKKVRMEVIDSLMASLSYRSIVIPGTLVTVTAAVLPNGFMVALGESACVSPENFDPEIGITVARRKAEAKARDELWKLEGYRLKMAMEDIKGVIMGCPQCGADYDLPIVDGTEICRECGERLLEVLE